MQVVSSHSCSQVILFLASFTDLCTVQGDMSRVARNSTAKFGVSGGIYYQVDFDVIAFFGSTELTAQMAWKDYVSRKPCFFPSSLIGTVFPGN